MSVDTAELRRLVEELCDYAEAWGHPDAAADYREELERLLAAAPEAPEAGAEKVDVLKSALAAHTALEILGLPETTAPDFYERVDELCVALGGKPGVHPPPRPAQPPPPALSQEEVIRVRAILGAIAKKPSLVIYSAYHAFEFLHDTGEKAVASARGERGVR